MQAHYFSWMWGRFKSREYGNNYAALETPYRDAPLQFRVLEFAPQLLGDALSIALQSVTCHIAADVLDIACEESECVGIKPWIDSLGEVDDFEPPLPVEDIIG